MPEQTIIKEIKSNVLFITLNRPDNFNALNNALMAELHSALEAFRDDDESRVAVITGAGKNFCTGADIKQFGDKEAQTPEAIAKRADTSMKVHLLFSQIAKPIIVSVRGYALAGGCGIAMAGDLVVASENAVFGYPEIKRGFVPSLVLVNLAKIIGRRIALEMLMTGERLSAEKALQYGMVNYVVPDERLEEKTMELAEKLASYSTSALANIKKQFYDSLEMSLEDGLLCAREGNIAMRQSKDFATGVKNFKKGGK